MVQSFTTTYKKGYWNKEEDEYIKYMVLQVVGFENWSEIVERRLSHRIPTQIRDRYVNFSDRIQH